MLFFFYFCQGLKCAFTYKKRGWYRKEIRTSRINDYMPTFWDINCRRDELPKASETLPGIRKNLLKFYNRIEVFFGLLGLKSALAWFVLKQTWTKNNVQKSFKHYNITNKLIRRFQILYIFANDLGVWFYSIGPTKHTTATGSLSTWHTRTCLCSIFCCNVVRWTPPHTLLAKA